MPIHRIDRAIVKRTVAAQLYSLILREDNCHFELYLLFALPSIVNRYKPSGLTMMQIDVPYSVKAMNQSWLLGNQKLLGSETNLSETFSRMELSENTKCLDK